MFKQRGMTFGGLIVLLMLVIFFAYAGFRTLPAYIEYWQLEHVLDNSLHPLGGEKLTAREVHDRFVKELRLNNIHTVQPTDLDIEPTQNGFHLTVDYSVKEHFWGAISLCMDFKAERESQ